MLPEQETNVFNCIVIIVFIFNAIVSVSVIVNVFAILSDIVSVIVNTTVNDCDSVIVIAVFCVLDFARIIANVIAIFSC